MAAKVNIERPAPGELEPWHLIGWLEATLERHGRISKADWNAAVQAGRERRDRQDAEA